MRTKHHNCTFCLDLLTGENAEPEAIAKVKFSETDSEYVKMAKTGGHAGELFLEIPF